MSRLLTHFDESANSPGGSGDRHGDAEQALGAPRNVRLQPSGFFRCGFWPLSQRFSGIC